MEWSLINQYFDSEKNTLTCYVYYTSFCIPGVPDDIIKVAKDIKPVIEIQQNGNDFVVTLKTPKNSQSNSFTVGQEAEITSAGGKKFKVTT